MFVGVLIFCFSSACVFCLPAFNVWGYREAFLCFCLLSIDESLPDLFLMLSSGGECDNACNKSYHFTNGMHRYRVQWSPATRFSITMSPADILKPFIRFRSFTIWSPNLQKFLLGSRWSSLLVLSFVSLWSDWTSTTCLAVARQIEFLCCLVLHLHFLYCFCICARHGFRSRRLSSSRDTARRPFSSNLVLQ